MATSAHGPRLTDDALRRVAGGMKVKRGGADVATTLTTGTTATQFTMNAVERERERKAQQEKRERGSSVWKGGSTFQMGMPIDALQQELLSNTTRALLLDDLERTTVNRINDAKGAMFAAALRNNRSLLALTVRAMPLTEIGLCSIFESVKRHGTLRAVDVQLMPLTPKALRGLRDAVRGNCNLIHAGLHQTGVEEDEVADDIDEAVRMNRLVQQDPKLNPYENFLFALHADEEEEELMHYMIDDADEELEARAAAFEARGGRLARPVCGHYMAGACRYGSRCRHYHPERSAASDDPTANGGVTNGVRAVRLVSQEDLVAAYEFPLRAVKARLRRARRREQMDRYAVQLACGAAGAALLMLCAAVGVVRRR